MSCFSAYDKSRQLIGEYIDSSDVSVEYVYVLGVPLAQLRNGTFYYYHSDQLASPLAMTNENREVVWDGIRDPFGGTTVAEVPLRILLDFPVS